MIGVESLVGYRSKPHGSRQSGSNADKVCVRHPRTSEILIQLSKAEYF